MKKSLSFCLLFFIFVSLLFSSESKIINENNEFGGVTVEYMLAADEPQYEQFYKVDVFYDNLKIKRKEVYYVSEKVQNENGFLTQDSIFTDGRIVEYRIHFTEKEAAKKGVKILIEKVDANDKVFMYGFSDGKLTAYSDANSFVNTYPVYSLDYLEKEWFEDESTRSAYYSFSVKYYKAKTFVKILPKSSEMTNLDKDLVRKYCESLGDIDKAKLYSKKYQAESGGKKYTVYMQDTLVPYLTAPHLTKDGDCMLVYGIIGHKDDLYLIATEFLEAE